MTRAIPVKAVQGAHEKWRPIVFAPEYWISERGRIKHVYKNGKEYLLSPYTSKRHSICYVKIHGVEINFAHLVYETWVGKIPDGYKIIHVDYQIRNNAVWNLKCVPRKVNGKRTGWLANRNKPVVCERKKKIYWSTRNAAKDLGISYTSVSDYCNGVRNSPLGLRWATEEEANRLRRRVQQKMTKGDMK